MQERLNPIRVLNLKSDRRYARSLLLAEKKKTCRRRVNFLVYVTYVRSGGMSNSSELIEQSFQKIRIREKGPNQNHSNHYGDVLLSTDGVKKN